MIRFLLERFLQNGYIVPSYILKTPENKILHTNDLFFIALKQFQNTDKRTHLYLLRGKHNL